MKYDVERLARLIDSRRIGRIVPHALAGGLNHRYVRI
jgi:hypothetical protein